MIENDIKPVAILCETSAGRYWSTSDAVHCLPLGDYYHKSAIDRLTAEAERSETAFDLLKEAYTLAGVNISRLTAERDEARSAVESKAGWEWKKRAEQAEAERDNLKLTLDFVHGEGVREKFAALKEERDAAVADAERYRWLRDPENSEAVSDAIRVYASFDANLLHSEDLDRHIDYERAEGK